MVEEEPYVVAAWAVPQAVAERCPGGQWGVMQKLITWVLPQGVASK